MYINIRPFVRYGIRAHPEMDFVKCTKTLTMCHCETANIWTHLIGALYFAYHIYILRDPSNSETYKVLASHDSLILLLQLLAACPLTCFVLSTLYHTYSCISPAWTEFFYRGDLFGISFTIFGSCIVIVWGAFYAYSTIRNWIVCVMGLVFSLNFVFMLTPCYSRP